MEVSSWGEPSIDPNTLILTIGTPKKIAPFFGKPANHPETSLVLTGSGGEYLGIIIGVMGDSQN